jgi:hypothetical protein
VNAPFPPHPSSHAAARPAAGPGRHRPTATGAICALLLCAIAQPQNDPLGVSGLVANDAARHLTDPDPVVRGEAALVVAAWSDPQFHTAMLTIARDPAPEARLRGIMALGLQATPGTATVLDELLTDQQTRTAPEGVVAAFALGLLPPDHAPATTSRVLSSFLHGNLRRQRDALLALLLGMARHEQSLQLTTLRRLFDDESVRDPVLRAQLLHLLLPVDPSFDGPRLLRLIERGSDEERMALFAWLGTNATNDAPDLLVPLERIAKHATSATERCAALQVLTRMRHLPALEIAARALRSSSAAECGQGIRSVLAIAGGSMRGVLDARVVAETDPDRKAAMLANFDAPPSRDLADHCAKLAADARQSLALRTAAARLLARSDMARAQPLLRDLFRVASAPAQLDLLAVDLLAGGELPPLARLLDGVTDPRLHSTRWHALLHAEHPGAVRQLLASIADTALPAGTRAAALTRWREARVLGTPHAVTGETPAVLAALLGVSE